MRTLISPAAVRALEGAGHAGDGAGEGAALVAEELGLDHRRRHGAAVDDDEGLGRAAAGEVQRLGDALLAGAGFALHEHRRVGAGERGEARGERAQGRGLSDEAVEVVGVVQRHVARAGGRELQPRFADGDDVAGRQQRVEDADGADEGAVLGAEVAHADGVGADGELAVQAGDARVGEHDVGELAGADAGAIFDVERLAGVGAGEHLQRPAAEGERGGALHADGARVVVERAHARAVYASARTD